MDFMAKIKIPRRALHDEVCRTTLWDSLESYHNALLPDNDSMLVLDRIKRLRKELA